MPLSMSQTLKRGVGRKILGRFLLAGVLPVIFTAALAYYEIGRGTQSDAWDELHASAKAYGVDVGHTDGRDLRQRTLFFNDL